MHLLFDPLIEEAAGLGAGLDWKTSLQELSAEQSLGVPEYVLEDDGPDHMKTFTAQVRVGGARYGNGVGRSKKEAEQRPPRPPTARSRERRARPTAPAPTGRGAAAVPELPEVEVVRAGLERHVVGARSPASRCCTRARCAATPAGRSASPTR